MKNQMIKGSFILEFPFKHGNFEKITYKFFRKRMLLYFYAGKDEAEFDKKNFKFTPFNNGVKGGDEN